MRSARLNRRNEEKSRKYAQRAIKLMGASKEQIEGAKIRLNGG